MAKLDKLIERLRRRPPEASFAEIRQLREAFGWHDHRSTGSHHVFIKENERPITIPLIGGRRVRRVYIDQVLDRLGLAGGSDEPNAD